MLRITKTDEEERFVAVFTVLPALFATYIGIGYLLFTSWVGSTFLLVSTFFFLGCFWRLSSEWPTAVQEKVHQGTSWLLFGSLILSLTLTVPQGLLWAFGQYPAGVFYPELLLTALVSIMGLLMRWRCRTE